MEFIEILLPLLVILYFVFSFFKGLMTNEDDESQPHSPEMESDEEAEARRIQEEIRRKIVARQQGRDVAQPQPSFEEGPPPLIVNQREEVKPSPEAGFRRDRGADERLRPRSDTPPPVMPAQSAGGNDIFAQLQEQKDRLEASRRDRRRAERDAQVRMRRSSGAYQREYKSWGVKRRREGAPEPISHQDIVNELRDEQGLRRAFIMREVLDRPLALRPIRDSYADLSR